MLVKSPRLLKKSVLTPYLLLAASLKMRHSFKFWILFSFSFFGFSLGFHWVPSLGFVFDWCLWIFEQLSGCGLNTEGIPYRLYQGDCVPFEPCLPLADWFYTMANVYTFLSCLRLAGWMCTICIMPASRRLIVYHADLVPYTVFQPRRPLLILP